MGDASGMVRGEIPPTPLPSLGEGVSVFPRVRDHHPGRREDLLEPRQEVHGGRGRRAVGDPVPDGPVVHLPAAQRRERSRAGGDGGLRGAAGGRVTPSLQFLLDIARQKNQTPLPLIKPYSGPRLPPDRYCLTAPNYRLKSLQKKVGREPPSARGRCRE